MGREWAESELAKVHQTREEAMFAACYLRSGPQLVLTEDMRVYAETGGSVRSKQERAANPAFGVQVRLP